MIEVEFHIKAVKEIEDIIDYYSSISKKLSLGFLNEFENTISYLSEYPDSFEKLSSNIQRANMKHFPFSIFFNKNEKNVKVLVVRHFKRKPYIGDDRV